jgi:hypothetical protein
MWLIRDLRCSIFIEYLIKCDRNFLPNSDMNLKSSDVCDRLSLMNLLHLDERNPPVSDAKPFLVYSNKSKLKPQKSIVRVSEVD